ncbi:hypothetical protein HXA34_20040 [Salipaludibacillus agaradhaerens]|jgi:hypothetical protein|uniref:hypothetical protein n=1 Tax=Salipaludibacillus agaradhaerens TaxID=76935 RepID=UPI0021516960|nr:hypothetical protein [Salipaludibacillus agaradhaerens]MCR6108582.1 hypothetical protein [Salipaludibacillus agaradhaerens]MCR6120611.1 hypothetical protein [Salipaludibacillus agaradhaerens]
MNQFPMVHPSIFIQNPLIKRLSKDPYWTVSDDNKRPVNARLLLDTGNTYNIKFDGEWPLVTLDELDADKNLQAVNRAYRLRARENRVIAVDVEPDAPESMKQEVLKFPAHFTELSKNGGVHLLILVPEDLINSENRYMFDELSVFKEPVPKPKDASEKPRGAHFEVLFNDHFITFTKRMLTQKPCVDYSQESEAKDMLARFLDNIVQMDKQRKKERELAKQYRIGMMKNIIDEEKEKMIKDFISIKPFEKAKEQAKNKSINDFGGDASRYEMSVANGIAFHTIRAHKLAKDTVSFRDIAEPLDEQDLAYAVYLLLKDVVPHREKHDEDRDGLPWLLFTSKRAYEYVQAQNAKRKSK